MLVPSADANDVGRRTALDLLRERADDAPKLNVTVVPGFAFWKSAPIFVNASVSDAAADTVIGARAASSPSQPARHRSRRPARRPRSTIATSPDPKRSPHRCAPASLGSWNFHDHVRRLHDRRPRGRRARCPSSSAASRVISDMTRCGPGLDVHHRDQAVLLHLRDDPREPVAGRLEDRRLVAGRRGLGEEPRQFGALDQPLAALRARSEAARRRPSAAPCRALTPSSSAT